MNIPKGEDLLDLNLDGGGNIIGKEDKYTNEYDKLICFNEELRKGKDRIETILN